MCNFEIIWVIEQSNKCHPFAALKTAHTVRAVRWSGDLKIPPTPLPLFADNTPNHRHVWRPYKPNFYSMRIMINHWSSQPKIWIIKKVCQDFRQENNFNKFTVVNRTSLANNMYKFTMFELFRFSKYGEVFQIKCNVPGSLHFKVFVGCSVFMYMYEWAVKGKKGKW